MYRNRDISKIIGEFKTFLSSSEDTTCLNNSTTTCNTFADSNSSMTTQIDRQHSVDLITAKTMISKLENKIDHSETTRKRMRLDFDRDLEAQKTEDQKKTEKLQALEKDVAKLNEKLNAYQESAANLKKKAEHTKSTLEKQVLCVQREKMKSDEILNEEIFSMKNTISVLQSTIERNEIQLQMKESEIEMLKEQLKLQTKKTDDTLKLLIEAEKSKSLYSASQAKVKELEMKLANHEESMQINKMWQPQLDNLFQIENENKKLKDEIQSLRDERSNVLLLEEQINSLQTALQRSEQWSVQCSNLLVENEALNNRLKQWVDISETHESPECLSIQIGQLQSQEMKLTLKCGDLNTKINVLNNEKNTIRVQLSSCEQVLAEKEKKLLQNSELIRRLQKKLLLLTKERDSLNHVLQSYENETSMNASNASITRIQSLENLLKSYQSHLEKLESDLDKRNNDTSTANSAQDVSNVEVLKEKLKQIEDQNAKLEDQVMKLEEKINQLQQEKDEIQFRSDHLAIKGDFDPSKIKVVHMKNNPFTLAQNQKTQNLHSLKSENEMLRERIKVIEEGVEKDVTERVAKNLKEQPTIQEIEKIKEKLSAAELKNQRLLEIFSKKSQEIREVAYILTGFRIDLVSTGQYKVFSMYAESKDDFLMFNMSEGGEMQLLENLYSSRLTNLIENYLQKQNSIPIFLSWLTIDLFNQQINVDQTLQDTTSS